MKKTLSIILAAICSLFTACNESPAPQNHAKLVANETNNQFADYWYAGKAELNSYKVSLPRYGEQRKGETVLVFVSEDFSKSKQVKLDYPNRAAADKVPVLKLNAVSKFVTGIYDYSMMNSVFTPIQVDQYPNSLKVSTTSQDWCGHSFSQYNLKKDGYDFSQYSYFESEGDTKTKLSKALLEDELMNKIRINPAAIATGKVKAIPGSFYNRLSHQEVEAHDAKLTLEKGDTQSALILDYGDLGRKVTIQFSTAFPHQILGWEETNTKGYAKGTTTAKLIKTIQSPYWQENGTRFEAKRKELGLK